VLGRRARTSHQSARLQGEVRRGSDAADTVWGTAVDDPHPGAWFVRVVRRRRSTSSPSWAKKQCQGPRPYPVAWKRRSTTALQDSGSGRGGGDGDRAS
jgi:hypothetical protein